MTEEVKAPEELQTGFGPADVLELSKWKNYVIYALGGVCVIFALLFFNKKAELAENKVKTNKLSSEVSTLKSSNKSLADENENVKKTIEKQNVSFAKLNEEYLKAKFDMTILDKFIQDGIRNGTIYKESNKLRFKPAPITCEESLQFMVDNLK